MEINLKNAREKARMTQTELAEKSGVGRVTINRIENGELKETTLGTLIKLSRTLNVSLDELVSP